MGLLEGMGYTKVRHYVGGITDWLEHGAAVEKSAALIEAPPVRSSARQNIRRRLSWLEILANWPLERLVGFWVARKAGGRKGSTLTRVQVDTNLGVVQLSGVVDSAAEWSLAERVARGVGGVKGVTNNLQVK